MINGVLRNNDIVLCGSVSFGTRRKRAQGFASGTFGSQGWSSLNAQHRPTLKTDRNPQQPLRQHREQLQRLSWSVEERIIRASESLHQDPLSSLAVGSFHLTLQTIYRRFQTEALSYYTASQRQPVETSIGRCVPSLRRHFKGVV
jgi:hypothetical protein